jgi:tetratricopeptide (TPR) repeat protein
MKTSILSLIFLLIISNAFAQIYDVYYEAFKQEKVDSVAKQLPYLKKKKLADAYNELASLHRQFNFDATVFYAEKALKVSEDIAYRFGAGIALMHMGQISYLKGNYIDAIELLTPAKEYLLASGNLTELAECYASLALVFHYCQIKKETGQELFAKALDLAISLGIKRLEAYMYFMHGRYLMDTQEPNEALLQWKKAAEILVEQNYGTNHDKALSWILIGDVFREYKDCRQAKEYYLKGHAYLDTSLVADCSILSQNFSSLGSCYRNLEMYDSAVYYLNVGVALGEKVTNAYGAAINHMYLANIHRHQGATRIAIEHYEAVLDHARYVVSSGHLYKNPDYWHLAGHGQEIALHLPMAFRIHIHRNMIKNSHLGLYRSYLALNDYPHALEQFTAYSAMNDTIQEYLKNKELSELGFEYETEHKDERIMFLEKQNVMKETAARQTRIIFLGTGFLMLLAIFTLILLLRQGKLRSRHQTIQLEQKLLRSQMNPHFIFNSLASIQNKIINEEPHLATDYLARFSHLFRNILEGSVEEFITLEKEIETVNNYLELQQLRYADKFNYNIFVDEKLEPDQVNVPPMLTQPFIENAIEHGIRYKSGTGNISINYLKQNGSIRIEIEDDGVGRQKAGKIKLDQNRDHKSLATNITLERIEVLNKKFKKKITLQIIDLGVEDGEPKGTRVVFGIPV